MPLTLDDRDRAEAAKLAALVRALNASGHNPATSGNYSLRSTTYADCALVSESGIDKSLFAEKNLLPVSIKTGELHPDFRGAGRKSSDETAVHLSVYRSTAAGCVLHSHLLEALLFADLFPGQPRISVTGLEIIKAFAGIKTHEAEVPVLCYENTQDIAELATRIEPDLKKTPDAPGLLLRRHGLYVWGRSVDEAKRHLEAFEYIFKHHLRSKGKS